MKHRIRSFAFAPPAHSGAAGAIKRQRNSGVFVTHIYPHTSTHTHTHTHTHAHAYVHFRIYVARNKKNHAGSGPLLKD
jgi:hypothetical protein